MIIYSIYKLVNQKNGKCYIGFTRNFHKRMSEHLNDSKRKHTYLSKAIRKYGWENFHKEIIYQSLDENYCKNIMESHFIKQYNSYRDGYNLTLGGQGNSCKRTEETRQKISSSKKGKFSAKDKNGNIFVITKNDSRFICGELVVIKKHKKPSSETVKKLSASSKGNKNRLGTFHSEEIKKIISERTSLALRGVPKKIISCPHCNKSGGASNMKRYHFDNCRNIF